MPGTIINNLKLTKVVDGDTIKVKIGGEEESLRLCCLDTEESWASGTKPVTNAGKLASKWAKEYFGAGEDGLPTGEITVDIEFDTDDPVEICMKKHRGNYGRLICYVFKGGENYNLKVVEEGWSPYFVKYGRSRMYQDKFLTAELTAQSKEIAIWNPETNTGGKTRNYDELIPWWYLRDNVVQNYRTYGLQAGVKSVRLDYEAITEAAKNEDEITVFCDLQGGIAEWPEDGALIKAGSPTHKFNLWIPDRYSESGQEIINLVENRYDAHGRSYVYASGRANLYPQTEYGKPQIILTDAKQLTDTP